MPSCIIGIIAYVILDEQPIEKSMIKLHFYVKRFVTILWILEAPSVSITGYMNETSFSSIIIIISISAAGILLDCFFLFFIWRCYKYLEIEGPCGSIMTISESSLTNYPTSSTIVIAVEIKEVQGEIEIKNKKEIKPCKILIRDFTLNELPTLTDDNAYENKAK
ncbi:hypothetical protein SteCoe_11768 [Stentor coeruleus]|uniref:Uncharacterized protein n=1 Tax=Stentor coeruleus TaxID=5963 RepID=A0A1R2CCH4_9CILI|nr:hypothetical protein SteCoe_11768 [Stentor coeruleus]